MLVSMEQIFMLSFQLIRACLFIDYLSVHLSVLDKHVWRLAAPQRQEGLVLLQLHPALSSANGGASSIIKYQFRNGSHRIGPSRRGLLLQAQTWGTTTGLAGCLLPVWVRGWAAPWKPAEQPEPAETRRQSAGQTEPSVTAYLRGKSFYYGPCLCHDPVCVTLQLIHRSVV